MKRLCNNPQGVQPKDERLEEIYFDQAIHAGQVNEGLSSLSGFPALHKQERSWGTECLLQNNHDYSLRILVIQPSQKTSKKFHMNLHQTLLVTGGTLYLECTSGNIQERWIIKRGERFVIAPGLPYRLCTESEATTVLIAGTPYYEQDEVLL